MLIHLQKGNKKRTGCACSQTFYSLLLASYRRLGNDTFLIWYAKIMYGTGSPSPTSQALQIGSYQCLSFRKQPATATPNPRTPRTYPKKLFVVTAIPKSIVAIPNNSILIPFIANTSVTNSDLSFPHSAPLPSRPSAAQTNYETSGCRHSLPGTACYCATSLFRPDSLPA